MTDTTQRTKLAQQASDYYARAEVHSTNNDVNWNECAVLFLSTLQKPERALELLDHSLGVDPNYFGTYGVLAQYYSQTARKEQDTSAKQSAFNEAVLNYEAAISHTKPNRDDTSKYGYLVELADLHTTFGNYEPAISTYETALPLAKQQAWRVEEALAKLYMQIGEKDKALEMANAAWAHAPEGQKTRLQELIALIQQPAPTP